MYNNLILLAKNCAQLHKFFIKFGSKQVELA